MEIANEKQKKEKEPLTTKQKVFLGLRIVGNVFFYSILLCLLIFSIMNINAGNGEKDYPHIFGRGFLSVQSDSMTRDESNKTNWPEEWKKYKIKDFAKGDLVNVKKTSSKNIKIGDVITFYDTSISGLNTHRVVAIEKDDNGKVLQFVCQGDKVVSESVSNRYMTYEVYCAKTSQSPALLPDGTYDMDSTSYKAWAEQMYTITDPQYGYVQFVKTNNVKGVATSIKYGGGTTLDWMHDHWLAIFIMPVIAVLIVEIFFVIRNIMVLRGEKNVAALDNRKEEIIAEEKERMRLELLAEMYGGLENVPEEMKNPKKVETSEEDKVEEASDAVENSEETNNEDAPAAEKVTESNEEVKTETTEEVVEKEPEVESDVEPQEENKEENN